VADGGGILRRVATRFSWGLADQGMSSLSNAALSLYVARELGASKFGAFSLAYVTYSFVLNASRGLATDPLIVKFSNTDRATWRKAVGKCTGTAFVVGLVAGVCVLAAAAVLTGTTRLAFLALGLTLPGLLLQDSWRYSFFAAGRGQQAFLNDTIWTVSMLPALIFLRIIHQYSVFWFVLVWGLTAAIGALAGPLQARVIPRPARVLEWISETRELGTRYLAENTSNAGAAQLRIYGVGIIAGLAAVGYVQAAGLLMGPFLVVFMGISAVTVPEAARILHRSPRYLQLYCLAIGGGLAVLALAWGGTLIVALPRGLGHLALKGLWEPTSHLVLPLTISVMGACLTVGATAGLHALGAAKRSMRAMIAASAIYLGLGLVGAAEGGATGTVRAAALATWIGALLWWRQLHVALREKGISTSLVLSPQLGGRTMALGTAYAAPLSARLTQSSNYRVTMNDSDSFPAVPVGASTADQLTYATLGAGDEGRRAGLGNGGPRPDGSDERANFLAGEPADHTDGDGTVIFNIRSASGRYKSAFLPLDAHDDLASYQWDFDEFEGLDGQEPPPAIITVGPRFTRLPYVKSALRRMAWLWGAIALIGALVAAAVYKEFPPAHYQASTSILLTTNPAEASTTAAMATEVALAQSRPVAELALSKLGLSQSESLTVFLKSYTVTSTTDRVLTITVSSASGSEAVDEANALATEFLQYRTNLLEAQQQAVLAALGQQINQDEQNIAALSTQIGRTSALTPTPARDAKLSALESQRSQAKTALTQLEQTASTNEATTQVTTESMIRGSAVLNAATPVTHSRLTQALVYVVSGLLAGLALGMGIVIFQAYMSDRPRRRDEVTQVLAAPVMLSVGTVRIPRWLPRGRRLAAAGGRDVQRIVLYLRSVVFGQGVTSLALVSLDNEDVAAVSLVSLAVSCARDGKRVVVADTSDSGQAAHLMGAEAPGVQTVTVNGASLVVAVPDRDTVVPVGPRDRDRAAASGLPAASEELTAAYASADLMLTLVTLDPAMGAEHLATWAGDAVLMVTAGQWSATRLHTVGELIRLSGTDLISAVLVGADKSDESLGITDTADQLAPADLRRASSGR
jgi:O-antigen/teichoic acid export membrane protein/capsular polysaccharide biosynthesis protein